MHTLKAENLVKAYGGRRVVNEVSISVESGEVVGLLGPNGAGKTTTFYMCVGLTAPDSGGITLDERVLTEKPVFQRAREGLGYLPQEPSVFRKLSVEENILAVLETIPSLDKAARKERLDELIDELSINHIRKSIASSLSGGERRRVEIARSLARSPLFILLDEPFAGIDPIAVGEIQEIIASLRERSIGVLITDHNVRETLGICDRAYILVDGKVLETGTPQSLANSDLARNYYLGENFTL